MNLTKLGQNNNVPSKDIEVFDNPGGIDEVVFTSGELLSNCPVTGQPDINTVTISYQPDKYCIESKSLKLYIWTFKDERIFGESLTKKIVDDIFEKAQPIWVNVKLVQNMRGGIQMSVSSSRYKEE